MDEGVILWIFCFFNLRDGKGWGTGNLTSTTIPLGPLGLHWSDLTVLKGVDGPTRLLYSCTWYFLSLYSFMFLRDFPLLYDKKGSSLKISFNLLYKVPFLS